MCRRLVEFTVTHPQMEGWEGGRVGRGGGGGGKIPINMEWYPVYTVKWNKAKSKRVYI